MHPMLRLSVHAVGSNTTSPSTRQGVQRRHEVVAAAGERTGHTAALVSLVIGCYKLLPVTNISCLA